MEEPIHTGTTFPVPLPARISFGPSIGVVFDYAEKQKNAELLTRINELVGQGVEGSAEPREGNPLTIVTWRVTTGVGGGGGTNPSTVITDIYELVGNDIEKSIWELPIVKTELFKLSGVDWYEKLAFIKRLVEDKIRGSSTTIDNNGTEVSLNPDSIFRGHFTSLGLNADVFANLISSLASGVEVYFKSAFVLRRTRMLPPVTNLQPSIALANKIFTDDQLIALLNPPDTIKFSIPQGFWQYKTPSMTQQADGNWQLLEEFWWADSFDPFIYGNYTP